jgi:hypothetical protein
VPEGDTEHREGVLGQAELGDEGFRVAPHRTDEDAAQAEGLGREKRVLGGDPRVNGGDQRVLEVAERLDLRAPRVDDIGRSAEAGDPDQEDRTVCHVGLATDRLRDPALAVGVPDGHHTPHLQVRGLRGRLRRRDDQFDLVIGDGCGEEEAHRAVPELQLDGRRQRRPAGADGVPVPSRDRIGGGGGAGMHFGHGSILANQRTRLRRVTSPGRRRAVLN